MVSFATVYAIGSLVNLMTGCAIFSVGFAVLIEYLRDQYVVAQANVAYGIWMGSLLILLGLYSRKISQKVIEIQETKLWEHLVISVSNLLCIPVLIYGIYVTINEIPSDPSGSFQLSILRAVSFGVGALNNIIVFFVSLRFTVCKQETPKIYPEFSFGNELTAPVTVHAEQSQSMMAVGADEDIPSVLQGNYYAAVFADAMMAGKEKREKRRKTKETLIEEEHTSNLSSTLTQIDSDRPPNGDLTNNGGIAEVAVQKGGYHDDCINDNE